MEITNEIYNTCAQIINKYKKAIKVPNFNLKIAQSFIKSIVYFPRSHVTGELIPNTKAQITLKLILGRNGTKFTDLDENEISCHC